MNKQVIIIGGGLSGLYSALQLELLNIPYLLFEAKPDMGGRIYSDNSEVSDNNSLFHDLGPTWIFPHHQQMQALVTQLGEKLFDQFIEGAMVYQASQHSQPDIIKQGQGLLLHRLEGGLYKLIVTLQAKLSKKNYQLNSQVNKLMRINNTWQISVQNTKDLSTTVYEAEQLMLALPPRLIHHYLTPENWASDKLSHALNLVPTWMANQAKFVAIYSTPFWREMGLSGQAFSRVGPLIEVHDASASNHEGFALFGFLGLSAQMISSLSEKTLKSQCIEQLTSLFGDEAQQYQTCYVKSWGNDKHVATDMDRAEPAAHPEFNIKSFSKELSSLNLYLVASEFAEYEAGYLEGAIDAAKNAVNQLKKNSLNKLYATR